MSRPGPKPCVPYWRLYVDGEGMSRLEQCALTAYSLKGVAAADPQWNDKMERGEATVVFTVQPVGWVGDWHENPAPQWIVVLSGRWWIESMARASSRGQANFRSARTKAVANPTAGRGIAQARSETSPVTS